MVAKRAEGGSSTGVARVEPIVPLFAFVYGECAVSSHLISVFFSLHACSVRCGIYRFVPVRFLSCALLEVSIALGVVRGVRLLFSLLFAKVLHCSVLVVAIRHRQPQFQIRHQQ